MLEHEDINKKIERILILTLVIVTCLYGIWKAYPLLMGPSITIYSPHDGDIVASSSFEISGEVSRVKEITLQGRPIAIDTDGRFKELLVASPPYTILVLTAKDFYDATVTKTIRVIPR